MTFLLHVGTIVSVIFWVSFVLSELVLASPREQRLPTGLRVAIGYTLLLSFFAAAFKLVPMPVAWLIGLGLLALVLLAKPRAWFRERLERVRCVLPDAMRTFGQHLAVVLLFFAP